MRERMERSPADEPTEAEPRRREPTPAAAAVLALQRSAGNAATARLIQRADSHLRYAPTEHNSIAPEFRTNHIGHSEREAIDQHGTRGDMATNTFVDMSDQDAEDEIRAYLRALPATTDISGWDSFELVTRSGYWCYETTQTNAANGTYTVRRVFATIRVTVWWNNRERVFKIGHMHGTAAEQRSTEQTRTVTMA